MASTRILHPALIIVVLSATFQGSSDAQAPDPPVAAKDTGTARDEVLYGWWADLEKDEKPATRALLNFTDKPDETVAFLSRKLRPLKIDAEKVRALIEWLGSTEPAIWKPAFEEMEYYDPWLAIDLETLMAEVTQTPARQRLVEVLMGNTPGSLGDAEVSLRGTGPDSFNFFSVNTSWWAEHKVSRLGGSYGNAKKKWTRALRAVILLEHFRTPAAIELLKEMAEGHPEASPTKAAVEALRRIKGEPEPAEPAESPKKP